MTITGQCQRIVQFFKNHSIFCGIIFLVIITNVIWILRDTSPPWWDIAGHSYRSIYAAQLMSHFQFSQLIFIDALYPPFAYIITGLLFIILGYSEDIPQYSLIIFIIIYLISVYTITLNLFRDKSIALLASWLSITFPLIAHFSRIYDLDFPLTALTWLAIALLLSADGFQNRLMSILTGIAIAAAMLTKWTAAIFLAAPFCFIVIHNSARCRWSKKQTANALLLLAATAILSAPWYFIHISSIFDSMQLTRHNIFSVPYNNLLSLQNFLFYFSWIIRGIMWPMALLFGIGLYKMIFKRHTENGGFLITAFLVPYFIMSLLLYSKESRYILPLFPIAAIIIAGILQTMRRKKKIIIGCAIAAMSLFFWIETSFGRYLLPEYFYAITGLDKGYGYIFNSSTSGKVFFGFPYPTRYHENIKDIVSAIESDMAMHPTYNPRKLQITVAPNSVFLNSQQIIFYARLLGFDTRAQPFTIDYSLSSKIRIGNWREEIVKSDYLITKTGDQGPRIWGPKLYEIAEAEAQNDSIFTKNFEHIQTWKLEGVEVTSMEARLYRKKHL